MNQNEIEAKARNSAGRRYQNKRRVSKTNQ